MRKRVPLNAIRAFEATARHGSVARAADELCVTPTAVSHHIRVLEDFLQANLFVRKNSRIELAPEARNSVTRISQALDLIEDAMSALGQIERADRQRISVMAGASVVALWLMPRLSDFLRTEPDVDINLRTFLSRKEAEQQEADIRICNWYSSLDCQIEPLVEEEIVPVCSPKFLAQFGNNTRDVLRHAPLIHVDPHRDGPDNIYPDWERYLAEYGVCRSDIGHGPRFNQSGSAIEAASAGIGVILGRSLLTERALATGQLVPVAECYPVRSPYFIVSSWKEESKEALQQFKDWLLSKVQKNEYLHAV